MNKNDTVAWIGVQKEWSRPKNLPENVWKCQCYLAMNCDGKNLDLASRAWGNSCWHFEGAAAAAKSLQSCLTLCDPIDSSSPGSSVPGILQTRTLEWVAMSFSNAWKWRVKVKSLSRVQLLATPWTAAYQAPPPMGFSRQEYWSGVPLPSLIFKV